MATQLGAKKDSKGTVVSSAPSVTKLPNNVPVPFPIVIKLDSSVEESSNVMLNGKPAFMMSSDTAKVLGDEAGTNGGLISGTTGKEAQPSKYSQSVKVNKKWAVRCGDTFDMNNKNTIGILVCAPPAPKAPITASGSIAVG